MLTVQEVEQLLKTIGTFHLVFVGTHLGENYLTKEEVERLNKAGIKPDKLYSVSSDMIMQSFYFGLIADALGDDSKKVSYDNLKEHFETGKFIPLTSIEREAINSVKRQFLGDIKASEGRIFNDVNNIIAKEEKDNRIAYEKVIRGEIEEGVVAKKTANDIARELGKKTGDWNRNFGRIVEYISHQAFDEGRAAVYERKGGEDVLVYKDVYEGACKDCQRVYLTNGVGSKPKVFKLSELKANGTNIGRKHEEWKPIIGSTHPHCFTDRWTPIYTKRGYVPIQDVTTQDLVLTHTGNFRRVIARLFTQTRVIRVQRTVKIIVDARGKEIQLKNITTEHPVYTLNGWVQAQQVVKGDMIGVAVKKCNREGCEHTLLVQSSSFTQLISGEVKYLGFCSEECVRIYRSQTTEAPKESFSIEFYPVKEVGVFEYPKPYRGELMLYNLSIEEDESYVAGGIVVHNCRCTLHEYQGGEWSKEKRKFDIKKEKIISGRKPVHFQFKGKDYYV